MLVVVVLFGCSLVRFFVCDGLCVGVLFSRMWEGGVSKFHECITFIIVVHYVPVLDDCGCSRM